MASFDANTTAPGYDHFRNDSMNDSVIDYSNIGRSFSIRDMFHFVLFTGIGGPICVVGFIANIICYKVLKADSGKKHRAATFLLQALAVADNLVLTFSFINMSIILGLLPMLGQREKAISELMLVYIVVYVSPFVTMAMAGTVWITVLVAIDRYIAVCHPLHAHIITGLNKTRLQVAAVSGLAIIFRFPNFYQYTIVYTDTMTSLKETKIGPTTLFGTVYSKVFDNIGLMMLPLVLLIFFNTRIIWELRKAAKNMDNIKQNGSRSENNITVVMVVIIFVFIVCNIPFHICEFECPNQDVQQHNGWYVYHCVTQVLLAANSATNFVVYYVLRRSFRRAFRSALCHYRPQAVVV